MKQFFVLCTFTLNIYGANLIRSFECKLQNYKNTELARATINEYFDPENGTHFDEYYAVISFYDSSQKLIATYTTEKRNEDIEDVRDDDPNSRSGWGGTAFYVLEKTKLVFITKAAREQRGAEARDYRGAFVEMHDDGNGKLLDEGLVSCKKK